MSAERPVALVTGVSRVDRVGFAIARRLRRDGFDVVITSRPGGGAGRAGAVAEALRAAPGVGRVDALALDLSDLAGVERFVSSGGAVLERLDALVHNASTYERTPLASVSAGDLEAAMRVNALAPALLSRGFAERLSRSTMAGGGAIVAMADIHALGEHGQPRREMLAYAMSKAALAEMVVSLAHELAPRVRVNAVAPGVVAFPSSGPESDPDMQARYLARVPLGRAGTPDDAASAVAWLIREGTYCTGQIVRVDGGRHLT